MEYEARQDEPTVTATRKTEPDAFAPGKRETAGHDHRAFYTHELPEETTEAASRLLVRVVPLVFGALLGSLADNLAIGLSAALVVSLVFDLSMEGKSLLRAFYSRFRRDLTGGRRR
jgi:hypothetical protein